MLFFSRRLCVVLLQTPNVPQNINPSAFEEISKPEGGENVALSTAGEGATCLHPADPLLPAGLH